MNCYAPRELKRARIGRAGGMGVPPMSGRAVPAAGVSSEDSAGETPPGPAWPASKLMGETPMPLKRSMPPGRHHTFSLFASDRHG